MCAVSIIIVRIGIIIDKIPACRKFSPCQVRCLRIDIKIFECHTSIQDGYSHTKSCGEIPCAFQIDGPEVPLVGIIGVIRDEGYLADEVWLSQKNNGLHIQTYNQCLEIYGWRRQNGPCPGKGTC